MEEAKLYNEIGSYVDSLMGMSRKLRDVMQPFDASAFEDITDENIRNEIRTACDQLKRLERERTVLPFLLSITIALKKDPEKLLELIIVGCFASEEFLYIVVCNVALYNATYFVERFIT